LFEPKAGVNAVGFFINDPNDSGGRFSFTLADSEVSLDFGSIFGGGLRQREAVLPDFLCLAGHQQPEHLFQQPE
jgi:hypothetical protein